MQSKNHLVSMLELPHSLASMNLLELRATIQSAHRPDWHKITCWGAGTGPSYRNSFMSTLIGSTDTVETEVDQHSNVAVLINDIDVSIAWGLDRDDTGVRRFASRRDLSFDFLPSFLNDKVSVIFADVFYRGSLVDREYLVAVDGAYLPMPSQNFPDGLDYSDPASSRVEHHLTQWEIALARLVSSFEHSVAQFDSRLSMIDYKLVERHITDENK